MKMGGSYGVLIPPDIRAALGLLPGDGMVMRIYDRMIIMRKVTPEMVVEHERIPTAALPPTRAEKPADV